MVCDILGRCKDRMPNIDKWDPQRRLEFTNGVLSLFGLKIKQIGRRTGTYQITGIDKYDIENRQKLFE